MTIEYIPRTIAFEMKTEKLESLIEFKFEHTQHSLFRFNQRGFTVFKISVALQYGEVIHKQGLIYYILGENNIPASLSKEKAKLKNTVVIIAGDSNQVITCYRRSNPFKHIKLKAKRLSKLMKIAA